MKKAKLIKLLLVCTLCLILGLTVFAACDKKDDPTYGVTFETDGGSEIEALSGVREVTESPVTTKSGYTLAGWYLSADFSGEAITFPYKLTADVTFYAKWTPNGHPVTFVVNGGSEVSALDNAETIAESPVSEKKGHTLEGWYLTEDLSGDAVIFPYEPSSAVTLYAKWTPNAYTITFDYADAQFGYGDDSMEVVYGAAVGELPVPGKDGYTFAGWFDGETQYTAETIYEIDGDLEVTAVFAAESYNVIFDYAIPAGQEENITGNSPSETTVVYGSMFELPAPSIVGYEFRGWFDTSGEKFESGNYLKLTDLALTAIWERLQYEIVFDMQGGLYGYQKIYTQSYYYGDTIRFLSTGYRGVEKKGHDFNGWYFDAECTRPVDTENYIATENITFYAGWTAKTIQISWHVGGKIDTSIPTGSYVYGQPYGELPTPATVPAGYNFIGWVVRKSSDVLITPETLCALESSGTLYAKFDPKSYTLTLDVNGGTLPAGVENSITVDYYGNLVLPEPTRENKVFAGWFINLGGADEKEVKSGGQWTTPDNATLKAKWIGLPQTLTFDFNGGTGSPASITVNGGVELGPLPVPAKYGYTFAGWFVGETQYTAESLMPEAPLTITAKWTANVYTVTFDFDGGAGQPESKQVTFDQKMGELPVATKTGVEFLGWYNGEDAITADTVYVWAGDMTAYARWSGDSQYTKGINYVYVAEADGVPAHYVVGGGSSSDPAYAGNTFGKVVLAPVWNDGTNGEAPVTEIANYAFRGKSALTGVSIPDSIVKIGNYAFANTGLETITVPASVTTFMNNVFAVNKSLKTAIINGGSESLAKLTLQFRNCTALEEITLPNGVTFTSGSFSGCTMLRKITFVGEGIYTSADEGKTVYKTEGGIKSLFYVAPAAEFAGAFVIEEGTAEVTTLNVGINATSIEIPASLTVIGGLNAKGSRVTAVNVAEGNPNYMSINGVLYTKDGTTLLQIPGGYAGRVSIGAAVTVIPSEYEMNAKGLTGFDVAAENTVYYSVDGVLWKKADYTLVCVPKSFTGILTIPEARTTILSDIERMKFALDSITAFAVSENNSKYFTIDGVLYYNKDHINGQYILLAYPCGKAGATYDVPQSITLNVGGSERTGYTWKIESYAFYNNKTLTAISFNCSAVEGGALYGSSIKEIYLYNRPYDGGVLYTDFKNADAIPSGIEKIWVEDQATIDHYKMSGFNLSKYVDKMVIMPAQA